MCYETCVFRDFLIYVIMKAENYFIIPLFFRYEKKIFRFVFNFYFYLDAGAGCGSSPSGSTVKPITLTYWRVFDTEDAFAAIIANYQKIHPTLPFNIKNSATMNMKKN